MERRKELLYGVRTTALCFSRTNPTRGAAARVSVPQVGGGADARDRLKYGPGWYLGSFSKSLDTERRGGAGGVCARSAIAQCGPSKPGIIIQSF